MRLLDAVEKWLAAANRKLALIGASFLLIEVFYTISNIVGRYLFNHPIRSTYEVCQLFMVLVLSFCWGYTKNVEGHVRVDIFESMFPNRTRKVLSIIMQFLSLLVFGVLAWSLAMAAIQFGRMGSNTDALKIPIYPFAFLMAFGALLSLIVIVFQTCRALNTFGDKDN